MERDKIIAKFEKMLVDTKRDGIEDLLEFIRKSDFYTAPASTRFHSCHEGGLLEHSMYVYDCLISKKDNPIWTGVLNEIPPESLVIIALLHDICKTYCYDVEWKNKKVYSETGSKKDSNGNFDWVTVPGYVYNDKIPYGHGEKSVMMISKYIELSNDEMYAIRWHMGFSDESARSFSAAIRKHPICLAINEADNEATFLLEKEE